MNTTEKLIELIGQSVNMMLEVRSVSSNIADERDRLRDENKKLKKALQEILDELEAPGRLSFIDKMVREALGKPPRRRNDGRLM